MCYAYKPVYGSDGTLYKVPHREFQVLIREGRIVPGSDGYHYAKDTVGVIVRRGNEIVAVPMRWDLIPRDFLTEGKPTPEEAVRKKNSRALNPATGKTWGFSSYNARMETVDGLWSFRRPWREGMRCAVPISSFKERPNMEIAPPEFRGREYEVFLDGAQYLAGIHDTWESRGGDRLESFTILTLDSKGNSLLESIWHERIPVILSEAQVERWLDPAVSPEEARRMCRQWDADRMRAVRVEKPPEAPAQASLFDDPAFGI